MTIRETIDSFFHLKCVREKRGSFFLTPLYFLPHYPYLLLHHSSSVRVYVCVRVFVLCVELGCKAGNLTGENKNSFRAAAAACMTPFASISWTRQCYVMCKEQLARCVMPVNFLSFIINTLSPLCSFFSFCSLILYPSVSFF